MEKEISKIKTQNGNTYDIKDIEFRNSIEILLGNIPKEKENKEMND